MLDIPQGVGSEAGDEPLLSTSEPWFSRFGKWEVVHKMQIPRPHPVILIQRVWLSFRNS